MECANKVLQETRISSFSPWVDRGRVAGMEH